MASFQEYRRRSLLPLACLGLAAYYLLCFLPLSRRAQSLDEPLQKAWHKLALSLDQPDATTLDFRHITNQLSETRQALSVLDGAKKKAAARLELAPALRAKLNAPFELVDYQNERSKQMDELEKLAKQKTVAIDPAVYAGLPEYTTETKEPALLWAALSMAQGLLSSAVRCQVTAIHSLDVPMALTNAPSADMSGRWTAIPLQLEFTAPAGNALRLLQTLPVRADETRAAGLPDSAPDRPPLFIDRLIIKKQTPDKPDEVRVWMQVLGFVLRD